MLELVCVCVFLIMLLYDFVCFNVCMCLGACVWLDGSLWLFVSVCFVFVCVSIL